MSFSNTRSILLVSLSILGACAGPTPSPQVVSGRAALASFPAPVTAVRAVQGGKPIVSAPVAADGSFSLSIPAGRGYHIEFVTASGSPGLVFPRQAGTVDYAFAVRAGTKPFNLGNVRYVGDPASKAYSYTGGSAGADGECEDGVDAATGAVCVDDNDEEGAGQCASGDQEANGVDCVDGIDAVTGAACDGGPAANGTDGNQAEGGDGETNDDQEANGVDCVDGIDAATGAECDGGPAANGTDGNQAEGGDGETNDDPVPGQAAVGDHNLPAAIGCDQEDGE